MSERFIGSSQSYNEMRGSWHHALFSFWKEPDTNPETRTKQAQLVEALKKELRRIPNTATLHEIYTNNSPWNIKLVSKEYPDGWQKLKVRKLTDVAYALRFIELQAGRELDARQDLPKWIGEWAIW